MNTGLVTTPIITHRDISDNKVILDIKIPQQLSYFEGHFDEHPIVPGVILIKWAVDYSKEFLPFNSACKQLEVIKFNHIVTPNTQLQLILEYHEAKHRVHFSYQNSHSTYSSGRIVLR